MNRADIAISLIRDKCKRDLVASCYLLWKMGANIPCRFIWTLEMPDVDSRIRLMRFSEEITIDKVDDSWYIDNLTLDKIDCINLIKTDVIELANFVFLNEICHYTNKHLSLLFSDYENLKREAATLGL